ncbi:glycosyl hydrolase [Nafulsella turpanensis]|uniref:glycosyl hydrolase n=1 Tax=Nafulsella turpanensis TaxID=1265690 RepID=UPI0012684FD9|nr:glycosyl hydrolase [Nafulsella turpanensis]
MKKRLRLLCCLSLSFLFASQLYAQKYEAEGAVLSNGARMQACSSCSGGYYVAQEEGALSFSVNLTEPSFYNISVVAAAPYGEKTNIISVNGISAEFYLADSSQFAAYKVVNTFKMEPGEHKIEILKSWGWIDIDFIELQKVIVSERFNLNQTLVSPNPIPEARALYDFLLDQYGKKIISGAMTLDSLDEAIWLKQHTGQEPALLGIDFMHSGRGYSWYQDKMPVMNAHTWYSRNGIPALMWHWRDPSRDTEEFYTKSQSKPDGTDFDISRIADESSAEYQAMLQDIDYVAGLLKELQEEGVPVIWRPLHEAAGGWFWWGAKGPEPLKELWLLMYDRMVNHHGLRNLIWVWTREPGDEAWYPGDAYVDIIGRDIYKEGDHSSQAIEFNNLNALYGGKKMVTLSEVGSFPDPDKLLQEGAGWSWFMPWYGSYTRESQYNPLALWEKALAHEYVITLDEMPALAIYERQPTGIPDFSEDEQSVLAYPTRVINELTIKSKSRLESVIIYNTLGTMVKQERLSGNTAVISMAGFQPGLYILKVNQQHSLRVMKE